VESRERVESWDNAGEMGNENAKATRSH
jgi:hypothetical protein